MEPSNRQEAKMKVREVMHKGVTWVEANTPISEIAQRMRDEDIGSIPVGEDDRLIGMVTDRDIACRAVANGRDMSALKARDVMTKGISWCRDDTDVKEAVHLMEEKRIRRLPVIDGAKRMVGMLALGDISHGAGQKLCGEMVSAVSAHHA
jgi:CBS domain-containing protein